MKVIAKVVEVLAWFEEDGAVLPLRVKLLDENEKTGSEVKIDRILSNSEEFLAGHLMSVFLCQSLVDGVERLFELKFENDTCSWILFKM